METPQTKAETLPTRQADRCSEQGHYFENCCSVWFEIYQKCKWCGYIKPL